MALSADLTAEKPELIEFCLYTDLDDETAEQYPNMPGQVNIRGPRIPAAYAANELAKKCAGEILMICADDVIFRTEGWDEKIRSIPGDIWLAYTNDGRDRKKCEHFFLPRKLYEIQGYVMPSGFEHFCCDEWMQRIAEAAGVLIPRLDIVTEHMHHKYGKAPNDDTYASKRRDGMTDRDNVRMRERAGELRIECEKVMRAASLVFQ
jgi:hypothetical protein